MDISFSAILMSSLPSQRRVLHKVTDLLLAVLQGLTSRSSAPVITDGDVIMPG